MKTLEQMIAEYRDNAAKTKMAAQEDWMMAYKHGFDEGLRIGTLFGGIDLADAIKQARKEAADGGYGLDLIGAEHLLRDFREAELNAILGEKK